MKNTLIIGKMGTGTKNKLLLLINKSPKHLNVKSVGNSDVNTLTEDDIKLLTQQPSLLVIEDIQNFKDLHVPKEVTVYATIQAETELDAKQMLERANINVDFQSITLMNKMGRRHLLYFTEDINHNDSQKKRAIRKLNRKYSNLNFKLYDLSNTPGYYFSSQKEKIDLITKEIEEILHYSKKIRCKEELSNSEIVCLNNMFFSSKILYKIFGNKS